MRILFRQWMIALFLSVFLVVLVLVLTFILFPPEEWSLLLEMKIFNISYLLIIGICVLMVSITMGIITSQLWRQHIHYVERQLDQLLHGQLLLDETYKDLDKVEAGIKDLDQKQKNQVEHAQKLATDRANDREKSLQEVVAQERNRLARDLHDSVSQQLFAASMMMSAINENREDIDVSLKHQIQMVEKMIHQSQLEMRALLLHLRPVALKGKSLQTGIEDLLQELMDRIPIKLDAKIEPFAIDKGIEDQLFRILQEAVSNTLRHAQAESLAVTLIKRETFIILRIRDNGKGFDLETVHTGSYGMETMKERAQDLGGEFKVISLPDKGTQIEVKIPSIQTEEETK